MVQIASLLYMASFAFANSFEPVSPYQARNNKDVNHLARRQDSVDVNVTVPVNDGASSRYSLDIQIPYTTLVARAWSKGGGDGQTISGGRLAGRISGRGTRNEIYGTARYGSGYGTVSWHLCRKARSHTCPSTLSSIREHINTIRIIR